MKIFELSFTTVSRLQDLKTSGSDNIEEVMILILDKL